MARCHPESLRVFFSGPRDLQLPWLFFLSFPKGICFSGPDIATRNTALLLYFRHRAAIAIRFKPSMEKLAGRLKWERTGAGLRVDIPARHDLSAIISGITFTLWGGVGLFMVLFTWRFSVTALIALLFFGLVFFGAVSLLAWNFRGMTTLRLDRAELRIERLIVVWTWSNKAFPLIAVRNLRYIPPTSFKLFGPSGPGQMRFETGDKTRKFATGLKETEALALIRQMLEIYEFPRDRAADYIGIR
jgi:hypothetical protein